MENTKVSINEVQERDEDFRLTAAQLVFMTNAWNAIERADRLDDDQFFADLINSTEYKQLFDSMSIDQAIDRYEIMIRSCTDC